MNKPNIFDIATKELHQDAFVTWLLSYADNRFKDSDQIIHQCGKELIHELILKSIPKFDEDISKVEAGRQWENIDVWARVNDKYLIIIEDKTFSSFHSNQLSRYKEIALKWCESNNFLPPICIYLKTGIASNHNFKIVEEKGFQVFTRKNFLKILNRYNHSKNDIFQDFLKRLNRLEDLNNQFTDKKIGEWRNEDWQGFYKYLDDEINIVNWKYVNNQNGGFWNAVLNWEYWGIYPFYLQIEQGNICFKLSTDPIDVDLPKDLNKSILRNELYKKVIADAKEKGLEEIKRPQRFGYGKYMTVAIIKRTDWLGLNDDYLNMDKVLSNIKTYIDFLNGLLKK